MLGDCKSKIFKASQRGLSSSQDFQKQFTFNYGTYWNIDKKPVNPLLYLNDESLIQTYSETYLAQEDHSALVIPITGSVSCVTQSKPEPTLVQAEQIQLLRLQKGEKYVLSNPLDSHTINFLHVGFRTANTETKTLDINLLKLNALASIALPDIGIKACIGVYEGRAEGTYTVAPNNGVFCYVVNGAFEMQNRLIEHRDGLWLWNIVNLEFEALAQHSTLLLLELPNNQ